MCITFGPTRACRFLILVIHTRSPAPSRKANSMDGGHPGLPSRMGSAKLESELPASAQRRCGAEFATLVSSPRLCAVRGLHPLPLIAPAQAKSARLAARRSRRRGRRV
jgi:hypothetical protein